MEEYLEFAKGLARESGEIMKKYFLADQHIEIKDDKTPVTIADTTINQLILDEIRQAYPRHGILAEEESDINDEEYVWVCDPLDGTIAYTLTIPISTFAIALVKNGKPIVAVIYDPFQNRMWSAIQDKGAYLNNTKISVNSTAELNKSVVSSSGPTSSKYFDVALCRFSLQKSVFRLMQLSSSQFESMLVASGKFAGVVFPGNSPHDMAAVKLIVEEAGGKVTNLFGDDQMYNQEIQGAVVSNSAIHDQLVSIINQSKH